jgi:hypothetical protein
VSRLLAFGHVWTSLISQVSGILFDWRGEVGDRSGLSSRVVKGTFVVHVSS